MIKLTSLNPRWIGYGGHGISKADGSVIPERHGVGISFLCPCMGRGKQCNRVYLDFENPVDGKGSIGTKAPTWKRTGDTFEIITLTPSILRKEPRGCGWHGYLTNGVLKECGE